MATRFWVGGTGTWDAADTTHWAATTGAAGGASVPVPGDTVTFDGSSGGGTVTVNTTVDVTSITMGAFTGTLDFATNNNNVTLSTFSGSGAGARTLNMGNGTWTITGTTGTVWDCTTVTSFTLNANSSNLTFAATPTGQRNFVGGTSKTYATVTINDTSAKMIAFFFSAFTITTLVLTNVRYITISSANTLVVTNGFTWTGTSSAPVALASSSVAGGTATLSVGGTVTIAWASIWTIIKAGAGSISATNSLDYGTNTGVTITAPNVSGGAVGVIGG